MNSWVLRLVWLVLAGLASIGLAYYFETDGLDVVIAALIALTFLLVWYCGVFVRRFTRDRAENSKLATWVAVAAIVLLCTFITSAMMVHLYIVMGNERVSGSINWVVMSAAMVIYIFVYGVKDSLSWSADRTITAFASTMASIFLLVYVTFPGLQGELTDGLMLVMATQLQLLVNFIYVDTPYVSFVSSLLNSGSFSERFQHREIDKLQIALFALGWPFLVSILIFVAPRVLSY